MPPKDEFGKKYPEITDHALLMENVRSKCVFEVVQSKLNATDSDDLRFFNYIFNMRFDCVKEKRELSIWCSNDVLYTL